MKRTPLRKVSKKRSKELVLYRKLRLDCLEIAPICQKCKACRSEDIHHMKGRGKYLNRAFYFLAVCRNCHRWIEDHPKESIMMGYTISRLSK